MEEFAFGWAVVIWAVESEATLIRSSVNVEYPLVHSVKESAAKKANEAKALLGLKTSVVWTWGSTI